MRQFNFKVVDAFDEDADIPVLVAGQIMIDVQNLLTDVGCLMVRRELRTQGRLPEWVPSRFVLKIQGDGGEMGSSCSAKGTLLEDALAAAIEELDRASMASVMDDAPDGHADAEGRRRIAVDLVALRSHLEGRIMIYGMDGEERRFRVSPRRDLDALAAANVSGMQSATVGAVLRDPSHRGRWIITDGSRAVPVHPSGDEVEKELAGLEGSPAIVTGAVVLDADGVVESVRDAIGCYPFPSIRFHRAISKDRDVPLLNPVEAVPGYDVAKGRWTLSNGDLGISVSKPSWDEAVSAFHEYFIFLWETYAESDEDFEGEEQEIRALLRSMAFPELLRRGQSAPSVVRALFIEGGLSLAEHHGKEAHLAQRRGRDRRGAHLHTDGPRTFGGPFRKDGPRQTLRGPVEEDQREDEGAHPRRHAVLRQMPGSADTGAELQDAGRRPHGAHDVRGVRKHLAHAVHQGAIT